MAVNNQRVTFLNRAGLELAAVVSLPTNIPRAFVLFAHCFTCGKDIAAASRISRSLSAQGFGVMRFDFTGLGRSEGEFGEAGFSANVTDLIDAAAFLRTEYAAPALLIGHSLGGTAVLAAADQIAECKALVTIGSPATPLHVIERLDLDAAVQAGDGQAVAIGDKSFHISQQFIDDFKSVDVVKVIGHLKRALLVFHAPLDDVVSVDEAGKIFAAARHPKSFVSLDNADHLLSNLKDAQYVAQTITAWAERYLPDENAPETVTVAQGEVHVGEGNTRFLRQVHSDDHSWVADEPKRVGGDNLGPDPYEHLLAALGTCTSMTIRMYANRKGIPLEDVDVVLHHRRDHVQDCEDCEAGTDQSGARIEILNRTIHLQGDISDAQRQRLLQIADRCPVHRTLEGNLRIETVLDE